MRRREGRREVLLEGLDEFLSVFARAYRAFVCA